MATQFILPELGENIEFGTVTRVLVAVGDVVVKEQPVIELETEKAVLEVPCPLAGTITEIHAKEGADLRVGELIVVVQEDAATAVAAPVAAEVEAPTGKAAEKSPTIVPEPPADPPPEAPAPKSGTVPASPSVRRLAREIGVDLQQVTPSAVSGRISAEDVKAHARSGKTSPVASPSPAASPEGMPLPDFSRWGEVESQAMSTVRRRTAERMAAAWTGVPHVTHNDTADITNLDRLRKEYGAKAEAAGGKLTVTAVAVKVLAAALKKFPQFNTSVDMAKRAIVFKGYYNIGVAVDTDRGLLVPVIKNADAKNVIEIAVELAELAERARKAKLTIEEMQGGCITITNLGGIGGTGFSPIINAPEVAVLGMSRSRVQPVFIAGEFVPRTLLPLSLSYDHRVIDGAQAARFTRWIAEALEEPFLMAIDG